MSPWIQLFLNQFGGGSYSPFQNSMPDPFADWQSYLSGASTEVPHVPRGQLMQIYNQYPQYRSDIDFSKFLNPHQMGQAQREGGGHGQGAMGMGNGGDGSQNAAGSFSDPTSTFAAVLANGQSPIHPNPTPSAVHNYVGWPSPSGFMPPGFGG